MNQRGDPLGFVLSLNLHRRHLTDAQKAVLALDILPHLEAQAEQRMLKGTAPDPKEFVPEGQSRDQAASRVGVNPRYVSDAKKLQREAPQLVEKIRCCACSSGSPSPRCRLLRSR